MAQTECDSDIRFGTVFCLADRCEGYKGKSSLIGETDLSLRNFNLYVGNLRQNLRFQLHIQ